MLSDLFLVNLVSFSSFKCFDFAYEACDGRNNQLLYCYFFHMMDFRSPTGGLLHYDVMLLTMTYPGILVVFMTV